MVRLDRFVMAALIAGSILHCDRASAAPVLDQAYLPRVTIQAQARAEDYWGQTFTVGIGGILSAVDLLIDKTPSVTSDLELYFFRVSPTNTVGTPLLASIVVPNAAIPLGPGGVREKAAYQNNMLNVSLQAFNIQIDVGDRLGVVVHSDIPFSATSGENAQQINWYGGCENNLTQQCGINNGTFQGYSAGAVANFVSLLNGETDSRTEFDFAFRTFVSPLTVTVPEPSTLALMISGASLSLLMRRRKRR